MKSMRLTVQHAVLGSVEPEMATPEELEKVGLTAGFISPVGLEQTEEFAMLWMNLLWKLIMFVAVPIKKMRIMLISILNVTLM